MNLFMYQILIFFCKSLIGLIFIVLLYIMLKFIILQIKQNVSLIIIIDRKFGNLITDHIIFCLFITQFMKYDFMNEEDQRSIVGFSKHIHLGSPRGSLLELGNTAQ